VILDWRFWIGDFGLAILDFGFAGSTPVLRERITIQRVVEAASALLQGIWAHRFKQGATEDDL